MWPRAAPLQVNIGGVVTHTHDIKKVSWHSKNMFITTNLHLPLPSAINLAGYSSLRIAGLENLDTIVLHYYIAIVHKSWRVE